MGTFITVNRALVEAVRAAAARYNLELTTWNDDWYMRLRFNGQSHFISVYSFDCNNEASARIAADKATTYNVLDSAGVVAVRHVAVATVLTDGVMTAQLKELFAEYGCLVVKPLRGARGVNVARFDDVARAETYMNESAENEWAASPFIDIERELRVVVFDGGIRLAYVKTASWVADGLRLFNSSQGASAEALDIAHLEPAVQAMALSAMASINLRFGAVDLVYDRQGVWRVLEINTGFALEHFALAGSENRAAVVAFYDLVIRTQFGL